MSSNRPRRFNSGPGRGGPRTAAALTPLAAFAVAVSVLLPALGAGAAQAPVDLGTATSFAILAGAGITNTGPTTIVGDVGSFPTPSQTGFGSVTLTGNNHHGDAVTQDAKNDLTTGYGVAAGSGPATSVPTELGGRTLKPGVYNGATLGITGTLTLDTEGDPAAVFIFQAGSTLKTAPNSEVIVLNGGEACNVFWQVGSSATLATSSRLIGSVLAAISITAETGATVKGRLLAQSGAVTLDTNTVTNQPCAAAVGPGSTTTTSPGSTTTTSPGSTTTTSPELTQTTTSPESTTSGASPVASGGDSTTGAPGVSATPTTLRASSTAGTPARSTTGTTPRSSTTPGQSTTTATNPPGMANTGSDPLLALAGALMVALGVLLTSTSGRWRLRRPGRS